jgi:DNA-binding MarR family transcriptional regulator
MALPSDGELALLRLVRENPDKTLRQLADSLDVTHPTVMVWLAKLEASGLVEYGPAVHGFRPKRITQKGVRFLGDVKKWEAAP